MKYKTQNIEFITFLQVAQSRNLQYNLSDVSFEGPYS